MLKSEAIDLQSTSRLRNGKRRRHERPPRLRFDCCPGGVPYCLRAQQGFVYDLPFQARQQFVLELPQFSRKVPLPLMIPLPEISRSVQLLDRFRFSSCGRAVRWGHPPWIRLYRFLRLYRFPDCLQVLFVSDLLLQPRPFRFQLLQFFSQSGCLAAWGTVFFVSKDFLK